MRIPAFASVPLLAGLIVLAGCTSKPKPRPRPVPRPVPAYIPPPPPPLASDWRDWPYTPGDWTYRQDARGSIAAFGSAGQAPQVTIRCDPAANVIQLTRAGTATGAVAVAGAVAMTIRTSTTLRTLNTQPAGATLGVTLDPRDSLLEAMGFSRGRFVIEQRGYPTLVLPSWAEIGRVTEDCRR